VTLLSTFNYWDSRFSLFIVQGEKPENVERKIGSGKKYAFSSSKVLAALKNQTAGRSAKSYRELGRKIKIITTLSRTLYST
jgi:ATP-dependent protease HslVU (ClpYQ) peptidase subunit